MYSNYMRLALVLVVLGLACGKSAGRSRDGAKEVDDSNNLKVKSDFILSVPLFLRNAYECQVTSCLNGGTLTASSDGSCPACVCSSGCTGTQCETCTQTQTTRIATTTTTIKRVTRSSNYSYVGCYRDSFTPRQIKSLFESNSNMTVEMCYSICSRYNYDTFSVQFGVECFCGNEPGTVLGLGFCSYQCSGNLSQTCGDGLANNIYNIEYSEISVPVQIETINYLGCYSSASYTQLTDEYVHSSPTKSSYVCIRGCKSLGYAYSASQNGSCFCGNKAPTGQPDGNCTTECPLFYHNYCGGPSSLTVWETRDTQVDGYLGCFVDNQQDRDLTGALVSSNTMSYSECINTCKNRGYAYAGLQSRSICMCGNSYGKYGSQGAVCNSICTGNSLQICGGPDSSTIFKTFA